MKGLVFRLDNYSCVRCPAGENQNDKDGKTVEDQKRKKISVLAFNMFVWKWRSLKDFTLGGQGL